MDKRTEDAADPLRIPREIWRKDRSRAGRIGEIGRCDAKSGLCLHDAQLADNRDRPSQRATPNARLWACKQLNVELGVGTGIGSGTARITGKRRPNRKCSSRTFSPLRNRRRSEFDGGGLDDLLGA